MTTEATEQKRGWEYVMSGVSYARITYPIMRDNPQHAPPLHHYLKAADHVDDHRFSLLYNAYAEQVFPISFAHFRECYYKTHADSGGLQLITQGAVIDEKTKREIYLNQAKYSDIAMSFDEIPLVTVGEGGGSRRGSMATRFFDVDGYREKARQSGQNLVDQIRLFLEQGSKAEPMMIIHGNNFDNAREWVDIMLETVPADLHQYIGGIAMGGGSFGAAEKEMVLRTAVAADTLKRYPHLKQYVHFLGIGSVRLLLAAFYFRKNGWLDGVSISYDSTSHSSAHHMGRHIMEGGVNIGYTRTMSREFEIILADVKRHFPDFPFSMEQFFFCLTNSAGAVDKKYGSRLPIIETSTAMVMASVRNFQSEVHRIDKDVNEYLKAYVDPSEWGKYHTFEEAKDAASFVRWDREFGNVFKSKKITQLATSILDFT